MSSKKKIHDIADLERKLQLLGQASETNEPSSNAPEETAQRDTETTNAATNGGNATRSAKKTGREALLARLRESTTPDTSQQITTPKGKQVHFATPQASPPPPPYEAAPPPFEDIPPYDPPPRYDAAAPPYEAPNYFTAPPALSAPILPSAPAYEDILEHEHYSQQHAIPPAMAPPSYGNNDDDDVWQGMSESERRKLMAEQEEIMARIEQEQRDAQLAAGLSGKTPTKVNVGAGESLVLHGKERTHASIKEGKAKKVQCTSCQKWMQIASDASFMYCPSCDTVTALEGAESTVPNESSVSDAELAAKLQQEEYNQAKEKKEEKSSKSSTWSEWIGGSSSKKSSSPQPKSEARKAPAFYSATTGEEQDASYYSRDEEAKPKPKKSSWFGGTSTSSHGSEENEAHSIIAVPAIKRS